MEPITLITGQPGHGKTLFGVHLLTQCKAEGLRCYQLGVDKLKPEYAEPLPVDLEQWHTLPKGSALIIDEAHKFLPTPGKGKEPEWVTKLAEIRHLAIRLILITQDPRSIHHFIRRRAGVHYHLERKTGHEVAMRFEFRPVADNPQDYHARQKAQASIWRYPKELYGAYHSADEHIVIKRWPKKLLLLPAAALALAYGVWSAISHINAFSEEDPIDPAIEQTPALASTLTGDWKAGLNRDRTSWTTAEQYTQLHTPVIEGIPWTAPIFADRQPTTNPDLYCVVIGDTTSYKNQCRCYSEQLTAINVERKLCLRFAMQGVYNPYRSTFATSSWSGERGAGEKAQLSPPPASSSDTTSERKSSSRSGVRPFAAPPPVPSFEGVR